MGSQPSPSSANMPHAVLHLPAEEHYQRLDDTMTDEEADTFLFQDVAAVGGKITTVVTSRTWAYFPHVSEDDEGHFFERMEAFQGLGCYFVGSLMNFETVEHTARYSVDLVDRCFA